MNYMIRLICILSMLLVVLLTAGCGLQSASTRNSANIVTIFHAAVNAVGPNAGTEQTIIVVLIALIIIVVCGPAHLSRQNERIVNNTKASVPG